MQIFSYYDFLFYFFFTFIYISSYYIYWLYYACIHVDFAVLKYYIIVEYCTANAEIAILNGPHWTRNKYLSFSIINISRNNYKTKTMVHKKHEY